MLKIIKRYKFKKIQKYLKQLHRDNWIRSILLNPYESKLDYYYFCALFEAYEYGLVCNSISWISGCNNVVRNLVDLHLLKYRYHFHNPTESLLELTSFGKHYLRRTHLNAQFDALYRDDDIFRSDPKSKTTYKYHHLSRIPLWVKIFLAIISGLVIIGLDYLSGLTLGVSMTIIELLIMGSTYIHHYLHPDRHMLEQKLDKIEDADDSLQALDGPYGFSAWHSNLGSRTSFIHFLNHSTRFRSLLFKPKIRKLLENNVFVDPTLEKYRYPYIIDHEMRGDY